MTSPTVTKVEHFSTFLCRVACRRINIYMDELEISHPRISPAGCAGGWQAIVASLHKFHRKWTEREWRRLETWNIQLESNEVVFLSVSIQDNNRSTSTARIQPWGSHSFTASSGLLLWNGDGDSATLFCRLSRCRNNHPRVFSLLTVFFTRYLVKNRKNLRNSLSLQINGP